MRNNVLTAGGVAPGVHQNGPRFEHDCTTAVHEWLKLNALYVPVRPSRASQQENTNQGHARL
jgi:hypothetical protein